jgi:hypothetical protein
VETTNKRNIDRTYGHIDLTTGDDAVHVTIRYRLYTWFPTETKDNPRQEWAFFCRMPRTIADALTASDWDFVLRRLDTRPSVDELSPIENTILVARCAGMTIMDVQKKVSEVVETNLFRVFGHKQIKRGNKAWLVPSSLVKKG